MATELDGSGARRDDGIEARAGGGNDDGRFPARPLRGVDAMLDRLVSATSWLWLVLAGVIVGGVVLRTLFGISRIELEELQWHLHAVGFLVGIVGCAVFDRHVRVDVFREGMDARRRDWVDLYGLLLFQLPFLALVLWSAVPLVAESYATAERSTSAGGLGGRWLFKSALPLTTVLLIAATLAATRRVARRLFGRPRAPRS
ncbi:MAG: TRAP transporter small permease subunit [Deltaproteobacteria bacterium]|nr:TRAP transporter small permease subunit [Deltaproteobacteria bacterium]